MDTYDHKEIEKKWQKEWERSRLYETSDRKWGKKNYYFLVEYPYPSGNLHFGHWYAFAVPDIFARKKRMEGRNVLFPIGFDSFGLPAENAAIKHGLDPKEWTYGNIERMTEQLKSMGNSFDWSRVVVASDPDYYKWTQWLFLKFFKKGLAERKKASVNWCPSCKTVLANEQVIDGRCERCESEVEEKKLEQWFLKITDYAERLLGDLEALDWPEEIKESQRNWIGKSEGAEITFKVVGSELEIKVFTTRPDTLFGATYLALAPEYEAIQNSEFRIQNKGEVEKYIKEARKKTKEERAAGKTGVELKGVKAIHPATKEEIPIWVADYVLGEYGTGAIMAVPAHDERDYEFAKKYKLPIKMVVCPHYPAPTCPVLEEAYKGKGHMVDSGEFTGVASEEAGVKMTKKFGRHTVRYHLRDWSISRQRYWGAPIPIVYDPEGSPHPVPEKHLPWLLPEDVDFRPTGEAPLARSKELKERTERIFGKGWRPEADTMDTFVDSSWYFLRYLDSENEEEFSSRRKQKRWMPVDRYSGGAEHTTLHLLYSRFFYKALYDMGLVTHKEPYRVRMNRGIVLGTDGQKMSKSRGNVIDPDENVRKFGADAVKMYLAFIGPYNEVGTYPWDTRGILGVRRFLDKVWRLVHHVSDGEIEGLSRSLHAAVKKVGEDIEAFKFNTAISTLMTFVNTAEREGAIGKQQCETFLKILAPFAPHLAEEMWRGVLGHAESIHLERWPVYDTRLVREDTFVLIIQVNGKVRDKVTVPRGIGEDEAKNIALAQENVKKSLDSRAPKRVIYVKDRLVNIVI